MWASHPRGRVIRRPQPDFSHQRSKIRRRPAPKEVIDTLPSSRCNYKYFGIHRTDITDHLKHTIPSHAFHPSLVEEPPLVTRGRGPRRSKEIRRPETAPAPSTVWFGRTCSDVSDWLRFRPPAHLGLDPDNKPLPYYPSSTSLVTDARWQTKEFPTLPNVLWHWWEDRPTSVPLPTNPQKVKFDTLLDALKHRIVRPRGPYTPPPSSPSTSIPTPRSGSQTPHGNNTPQKMVPPSPCEALQSRAQTSQLQSSGNQPKPKLTEFPSRPTSAASSTLPSRPNSVLNGIVTDLPIPISECKCGLMNGSPRPASTPRDQPRDRPLEKSPRSPSTPRDPPVLGQSPRSPSTHRDQSLGQCPISPWAPATPRDRSTLGESSRSPQPLGSCGCEASQHSSKSSCTATRVGTVTPPSNGKSPRQVETQKCACNHTSPQVPSLNLSFQDKHKSSSTPVTPNSKPPNPSVTSGKPPPAPRILIHPNPPHVPRKAIPREPCKRHHAAIPPGLYVQGHGQGSSNRGVDLGVEKKLPRAGLPRSSQGLTIEDMKKISPDSFATQIVWAEKCKQFGQGGLPWPMEEKKAVKAY